MTNLKLFQNTNKRYQLRNSELQACNVKEKEAVLQRFFSNFRNCGCTLQSCNFITRELYYIYFFSKFSLQLFHNTLMKIFVTESSRVLGSSLYCVYVLYVVCLTFSEEIRPVSEWVSYLKSDSTRGNFLIFLEVRLSLHNIAWRVSVFGTFLVRIFQHSNWIRWDTPYPSVFTPNVGK